MNRFYCKSIPRELDFFYFLLPFFALKTEKQLTGMKRKDIMFEYAAQ